MARNKLEDLRNHLFAQLERLENEDVDKEKLELEMKRAKSIAQVSQQIIETAKVEVDFIKILDPSEGSSFWVSEKSQKKIT